MREFGRTDRQPLFPDYYAASKQEADIEAEKETNMNSSKKDHEKSADENTDNKEKDDKKEDGTKK